MSYTQDSIREHRQYFPCYRGEVASAAADGPVAEAEGRLPHTIQWDGQEVQARLAGRVHRTTPGDTSLVIIIAHGPAPGTGVCGLHSDTQQPWLRPPVVCHS